MDLNDFEAAYMTELNGQQRRAVLAADGPVLLLATPGSGKTRVLVTRLGYMVLCLGIPPSAILTMTYTVAAAGDMKSRYAALFGSGSAQQLAFRTINGVSSSIIAYAGRQHFGKDPYELESNEAELVRLIRSIYQEVCGDYAEDSDVREIRRLITYAKNMMLSEEEIRKLECSTDSFPEIFRRYREALRASRRMDYDDQLAYALAILRRSPEVLAHFKDRFRYICVDEAQDTSKIQHEIIRLLSSGQDNLFMVGDEDQSIYGFRAAYPDALMRFEQDHPRAQVLLMEKNYRSSEQIVAAANRFVAENRFRREKTIVPTLGSMEPVHGIRASDRAAQYEYLAAAAPSFGPDTAILFRNNDSALPLIDRLDRAGIPFRCTAADDSFFSHRVVRDILDIIRFAYEPSDRELFLRLYYKTGAPISKMAASEALRLYRPGGPGLFEILSRLPELPEKSRDAAEEFARNLRELPRDRAERAVRRIWNEMNYGRYVLSRGLDRGKLFILCQLARDVESPAGLAEKLEQLAGSLSRPRSCPEHGPVLSTIHSSKGLEYDTVYLLDVIDGVLPSVSPDRKDDPDQVRLYEEERRLFYVGMTRARRSLFLFRCGGEASSFTQEVLRAVPVLQNVPPDDIFSSLGSSPVGRTYREKDLGKGRIHAACEDRCLIVFPDGTRQLLTLEEMLSRRAREYRLPEAAPPAEAPSAGPVSFVPAQVLPDSLQPGDSVTHRVFGQGTVVSVSEDILEVDFGPETGRKKLLMSVNLQHCLLSVP